MIAEYILGNPTDYTFSSLVGAVDGLPRFAPAMEKSRMGTLYIPRTMTVALIDGQHRRAAIEQAVREDNAKKKGSTGVGDESISVVLFIDNGLEGAAEVRRLEPLRGASERLARAPLRPPRRARQLGEGGGARGAALRQAHGRGEDLDRGGSGKLFALNAVHEATRALLRGSNYNREESTKLAVSFWSETAGAMHDWQAIAEGKIKATELREKYIHAHAVAIEEIGRVGNALVRERPETWKTDVAGLTSFD